MTQVKNPQRRDPVSEELRVVEAGIDSEYTKNPICAFPFSTAAIHLLRVCEEQHLSMDIHGYSDDQQISNALADNTLNRTKPALLWLRSRCTPLIGSLSYNDDIFGHATQFSILADEYLTFESIYTYASRGLVSAELEGDTIRTSGGMRNDSVYDAYDRIIDSTVKGKDSFHNLRWMSDLSLLTKVTSGGFRSSFS